MRALFSIALFTLIASLTNGEEVYGKIDICYIKYVEPGEDFKIECRSDEAVAARIYTPHERVPTEDELTARNEALQSDVETTVTFNEYQDATFEEHDGYYTCVVHHEEGYSTDVCRVVVKDLCEDAECDEVEVCEPDYSTGTIQCTCEYGCPFDMAPVCDNRCKLHWNECAMHEQTCVDGLEREIANQGFCPNRVHPEIREIDQDISAELGDKVILSSGLIEDGTPMVTIQWVFYPENGSPTYLSASNEYEFTATEGSVGTYRITLMQCMEEDKAVHNEYRFRFTLPFTTIDPTPPHRPTSSQFLPDDLTSPGYTCSAFPGGVIDDFNARAHFYDLSCTHVLASDLFPDGSYLNPWFIYGTFDIQDGKSALMAMTFYLGREIFEVQRGWLVHSGGHKFYLEEGVPHEVGESGCMVTFEDLHIKVHCEHFEGYYDGIMSGHIKLRRVADEDILQKGRGYIGLCFDNDSGLRPNWQIGNTQGRCEVNTEEPACEAELPEDCKLSQPPQILGKDWTTCGAGAENACGELNCDGATPTPTQECSLQRANRVNCSLKMGKSVAGVDSACPDKRCDWLEYVVAKGCPQDHLPFVCP